MKKKIVVLFLHIFTLYFLLTGCTKDSTSNNIASSAEKILSESTSGERIPSNVEINVLVDELYYRIWEEDGLFSSAIYDKEKQVVQLNENRTKQPDIMMVNESIVCVTEQAGTGIATSTTYFYDVENNRFSDYYTAALCQANDRLVYAESDKVVIKDIFDDNGFYQEVTHFYEPLSAAAFPFLEAEFVDDATAVRVTYLTGEHYTETSEVFELQVG